MTFYDSTLGWMEDHAIPCPFRALTGCDCPTCGMQRSIFLFLRGKFEASLEMHPAGILTFLLIIFLFIQLKFRFAIGTNILRWGLSLAMAISLIAFGLKIYRGNCCAERPAKQVRHEMTGTTGALSHILGQQITYW